MSDQAVFFAATFFDSPGLLAVRFTRQVGPRPLVEQTPESRIEGFARERRPDVSAPRWFSSLGSLVGLGMALAVVGAVAMTRGGPEASGPVVPSPGPSPGSNPWSDASPAAIAAPRLLPTIEHALDADAAESRTWPGTLSGLADDYAPTRADLRPWALRTLLDVPRELAQRGGDATGGWLRPRCSASEREDFRRGGELAKLLRASGCGPEQAVILDLPGPSAVAAAAGMAGGFAPVVAIDNLPHPAGVVPSAQTLATLVYWRPTIVAARNERPAGAAPVFVLEGARLAPYRNEPDRFDNRSRARLPDAAALRQLGVTRLLYVRERAGQVAERDDLNQAFVDLAKSGIEIRHIGLDRLDTLPSDPAERNAWWWSRYAWGQPAEATEPVADADAQYRSTPRESAPVTGVPMAAHGGGMLHHATILSGLSRPRSISPPARASSSSSHSGSHLGGGSWSRSSGSHHYG